MYIGEFSEKFGVSADTIRYYINIGLLLPKRIGNKYFFQDDCMATMEEILSYKALNFTLDEINALLSIDNAFHNINQSNQKYILDSLINKQRYIKQEMNKLETRYNILEEKIKHVQQLNLDMHAMGIPKDFLDYLSCPLCGKPLHLNEKPSSERIYNGHLECNCGYLVRIHEGIINTQPTVNEDAPSNTFDSIRETLSDYCKEYLNCKTMNQLQLFTNQHLLEIIKNKKIIVSMGISPGKILKNIIHHLDEDCYYIIIDDNYHYLRYIKQNIDSVQPANNIIFMYGHMEELPLRHKSADLIVDLFKTDYLALYQHNRGIHRWKNYLRNDGHYFIFYCTIKLSSKTAWSLDKKLKKNFILESIRSDFKNNAFIQLQSKYLGALPLDSILYKSFHSMEEELDVHLYPADPIHLYCDLYTLESY